MKAILTEADLNAFLFWHGLGVFGPDEAPGHSPHVVWSGVVEALQEICDRAAAHDVTIAVQNHHDVGFTPTQCWNCWGTSTVRTAK